MRVSLIIPVYNESLRVINGLDSAIKYLGRQPYQWEIIIVDDGSTDNTSTLVGEFERRHASNKKNIFLLRTASNFGKGHAIRIGIEAAIGDLIVFSDIDFSVPIESTPKFITALSSAHGAIGSRRLNRSSIVKHQPKVRELLGQAFTRISNLVLGLRHTDLTCGFKAFRREVALDLFRNQHLNGWAFDSEILFLARKFNYQITEIPVVWHNDPRTKVDLKKDLPKSLMALIYIRLIHL